MLSSTKQRKVLLIPWCTCEQCRRSEVVSKNFLYHLFFISIDLVASAEASFLLIDKKIRTTLSNKQFPLVCIKQKQSCN